MSNDKTTLNKIYDGEIPDDNEIIWDFVGLDDFDKPLSIIEISPVEIWNSLYDDELTIKEIYNENATKAQKRLVSGFRKMLKKGKIFDPIVISGDTLVDGFHRIAALALEGVESALAVNLEELDE